MSARLLSAPPRPCFLFLLLLCLLLPTLCVSTATIATVVAQGNTVVFQHRVEALLDERQVYTRVEVVEVSRTNSDTLLVLASYDDRDDLATMASDGTEARAVAVTTVGGRVTSLLHHAEETPASLNYKRALVSLLTPALHSHRLVYHTQSGVLGTCEVRYEHEESRTVTWLDMTRCSHFTYEQVLSAHNLPLLHLAVELEGSSSTCDYSWRGADRDLLEGVRCTETLLVAPRYTPTSQLLNITLTSSLTPLNASLLEPEVFDYMQGATETTDLTFQLEPQKEAQGNVLQLMEEVCFSEGEERLTAELLQRLSYLSYVLARSTSELPDLPAVCPVNVRRGVALAMAVVGGPRTLHFFVKQLAELSRASRNFNFSDDEYFFTLALRNLVNPEHHSSEALPRDFFLRRENQIVYDELVDYLLTQTPPAVAGVAVLLEGLSKVAPQLFQRLLQKSGPFLLPRGACERGDYAEAVRLLRSVSGLSTRPQDYVTSLGPCFATDNVDVIVAAMDTLSTVDCDMQGVTELQKVGLDSPSDSEIRIAAYRGLVHCLPSQPDLIQTVAKALDSSHDDFSTQVASYVWSHIQSVISSDDPSLLSLKEVLSASDLVTGVPDPVWYDPRRHSRHLAHTVHLDARTSVTVTGDLAWGRYSPAPRAIYLTVALHHEGATHQFAQVMLRVTGVEAMVLSVPWVEEMLHAAGSAASQLWSIVSRMAGSKSRDKRDVTHNQITEFLQQVITRIPAAYRIKVSTVELYLRLLDTHALYLHLEDLRYSSPLEALATKLQAPLRAVLVALAPLLDNTLTLATSSGVPVALGVHGMAGVNARCDHIAPVGGGVFNLVASGGMVLWGRANVGGGREAPLVSHLLWTLDFPISASYQYEGEGLHAHVRLPRNWPGHVWMNRRDTTLNGTLAPANTSRSCWGREEVLEVCLEARDGEMTGGMMGRGGWLAPYFRSLTLPRLNPAEPINVTFSFPKIGETRMRQMVLEAGGQRYSGGLVVQNSPFHSFTVTLNTPLHVYLFKGLAGTRERVTQVASLEASMDQDRYGLRLQLSTPQLVRQKVWSPSVFITTPAGGEEEAVRVYFSVKDETDGFQSDFIFQTLGPLLSYLKLEASSQIVGTVDGTDGSLKILEIRSLEVTSSSLFSMGLSGRVHLAGSTHGEGHFKVRWAGDANQFEFSVALTPAVTFLGISQFEAGGTRGTSLRVSFSALHNSIQAPMGGSLALLLDTSTVELDISLALAHLARINFSHKYKGPLNLRTAMAVRSESIGMAWSAGHELLVQPGTLRHEFNVSWSEEPSDTVSSVVYYTAASDNSLSHSFRAQVVYPGQLVEVEQTLEEVLHGTYKSKLLARMDPGRTLNSETILITRIKEHALSYGFSNTLRLDTWATPLSLVGAFNCVPTTCSVMFTVDRSGDQLLDLKVKRNSAAGVSRTNAHIIIMQWLNGTISLDAVQKIGYYDFKCRMALWAWQRVINGRAQINLLSTDAVVSEALLLELQEDGKPGLPTHSYNGTLRLDQAARTLFIRQEVWPVVGGAQQPPWQVLVEGGIGDALLNSYHFAKGLLRTPVGQLYSANGEAHTALVGQESVEATVMLSAAQDAHVHYLLAWEMDLQTHNTTNSTTNSKQEADTGEETAVEEATKNTVVMSLESFGRLKTPPTGELELRVDCKRKLLPPADGTGLAINRVDTDVRLTLVEQRWEVGGTQGSLSWTANMYSLNGRTWLTQGQRSIGLVSFGAAKNQSLKSSHILSLMDPGQAWGRLVLGLETEHLGSFPHSFQSSAGLKLGVGNAEAGQALALVLWTPAEAAVNLALTTFLAALPGGNLYLKMWGSGFEGHAAWADVKGGGGVKWDRGGRDLEVALKYEHPGAALHVLETTLSFSVSQPLYPPLTLVMAVGFNLNGAYQLAVNAECRSGQENYLVTVAMQHPGGSSGLRLLVRKVGITYGSLLACFLNDFAMQITGAYTARDAEQEMLATIKTSLLPEPNGYTLKLVKKMLMQSIELLAFLAQGGAQPDWVYGYRVVGQIKRDIKGRLRTMVAEDTLTHHILQTLVEEYKFFQLFVNNHFDEMELEMKFLEFWPTTKVSGTLRKGKDTQLSLTVTTPTLKHLLEGRILFSSGEWQSAHSGSLAYTQRDKGGRVVPLKVELEAIKWNSNKQKYNLLFQCSPPQVHVAKELPFAPDHSLGDVQYPLEQPPRASAITSFQATLEVMRDPTYNQYKVTWETDETVSYGKVVMARNPHGGNGLVQYRRHVKGIPKSEIEYLLEGNYRRVANEVMFSCTLDQSSIGRPRAINFLHSEGEGYTELLLDLFAEESDQVILVIMNLPEHFRFRIGQYGNTFLLLGYQSDIDDEGAIVYKVQAQNSGRTVEMWSGSAEEDARKCMMAGVMLETPTLAPTHNMLKLCPTNGPYVMVQTLGVEEHEGPYLKVGQISGPGGLGLQVGTGRLRPLDTPPALTLTANVQKEVLEVLTDWQVPSLSRLESEFASRGTSVVEALWDFGYPTVMVEGGLYLTPLISDTEDLIHQTFNFTRSTSLQLWTKLVGDVSSKGGGLFHEVSRAVVRHAEAMVDTCVAAAHSAFSTLKGSVENVATTTVTLLQNATTDAINTFSAAEERVVGAVSGVTARLQHHLGPPLTRVHATLAALTYNDDQSLYALVSRAMGAVRRRIGRREGVRGYVTDQLLTRAEKVVVENAYWEGLRDKGSALLRHLQNVTTISIAMPHQTALMIRVAMPSRMRRDLEETIHWLVNKEGPRLLMEAEGWTKAYWARTRYLLTWPVYGEAMVFGWDQGITWDGRQVTPLLTDACRHLLVLLTHAATPTAITLHMEDLDSRPREVLTFFSGNDIVTLDSLLKMTYNAKHIRQPLLEKGDLTLRWSRNAASITSTVGLSLECQLDQPLCRLVVSDQHFAGTVGLLGVFDYDNSSDYMTSRWEMPATEEEWVQSWRVGTPGQCASQLPESHMSPPHGHHCTDLFQSSNSPYRWCFRSVPPSPYLQTCQAGWECASQQAFLQACSRHYHELTPNLTCSSCLLEETREEGTEGLRKEVVIITDFECWSDPQDLVTALSRDTKRSKVMIRYIGRGPPSEGPFQNVAETVVDNGALPIETILNSALLDFSERALKTIIFFDCQHPRCEVSSAAPQTVKARETLLSLGIQLHVITMDALTIMDQQSLSRRAARQLIGLDGHTAYLLSHARKKKVKGKRNIRRHLEVPIGNTCTHLAVETDGSVFSLRNIKMERKHHRRILQQLVALRVEAGRAADYLGCRVCKCGAPCTLCHPPPPLVYLNSERGDDNDDDDDYDEEDNLSVRSRGRKRHKSSRRQ
ncbi:uncharacterized protein LOC135114231 isoform X2 [Scylla paramamosain]|uniref:uncharacterized protein LOC135114231 isoform X2 n=1 Tax=Scylla paramamosain TaxID=85552 RepID=UPI003083C1A7